MLDFTPRAVYRRQIELLTKECEKLKADIEGWKCQIAEERTLHRTKLARLLAANRDQREEYKQERIVLQNVLDAQAEKNERLSKENARLKRELHSAFDEIKALQK